MSAVCVCARWERQGLVSALCMGGEGDGLQGQQRWEMPQQRGSPAILLNLLLTILGVQLLDVHSGGGCRLGAHAQRATSGAHGAERRKTDGSGGGRAPAAAAAAGRPVRLRALRSLQSPWQFLSWPLPTRRGAAARNARRWGYGQGTHVCTNLP